MQMKSWPPVHVWLEPNRTAVEPWLNRGSFSPALTSALFGVASHGSRLVSRVPCPAVDAGTGRLLCESTAQSRAKASPALRARRVVVARLSATQTASRTQSSRSRRASNTRRLLRATSPSRGHRSGNLGRRTGTRGCARDSQRHRRSSPSFGVGRVPNERLWFGRLRARRHVTGSSSVRSMKCLGCLRQRASGVRLQATCT